MMSCTTVQKSNVLVFRSKLLQNVHVPEFEINNTAIDRVSMYNYLGHCINDELSDENDMMRQRNICRGECIDQKVLHVYRKCKNCSV